MNDDDIWIQISDSQLKIHLHPQEWANPDDDEKLTFVVNWAKPLHPVDLNIQLLSILEYGGNLKEYIAKLTRDGVQSLYNNFLDVLRSNSPVVCRALLQKLRPSGEDGAGKARRMEQWGDQ
ncbi:RNA-directed RNA polymerase [Penicillium robsamsonii]|uniref:RNA-directed RNA polymerase n=1 Tax=Penicillium robsamsonii TaxID=1792511 RepID=UPI002546856D|nr:RNA-directed RNA polymerase [Penicillium robsamsonii]KAJ5836761.1 RNA-directed RNA polymerase [Penicillium robsamsonii]